MLERHCARCHQTGKLTRETPAARLGNILSLDVIARNPRLVQPGNPDASRLWTHMMRRLMPYDVFQEHNGGAEPSAEEILAVRGWIEALPPAKSRQKILRSKSDEPAVTIKAGKRTYASGDVVTLRVSSTVDCRLTLISIDGQGRGTVILPNDLETDMQLAAGQERVVPAADAGYLLRVKDAGRERIVGLCNTGAGAADGIKHDFERQRFTELGDYAQFLAKAIADSRKPVVEKKQPEVSKRRRRRVRVRKPALVEPYASPQQVLRTGIILQVR